MLKKILNKLFTTESKKVETPSTTSSENWPFPKQPDLAPAPVPEIVTMATTTSPAPKVTTVEVKSEPAVATSDILTINLTSDTINLSTPEPVPAPKPARTGKGRPPVNKPVAKPATKPAVIKGPRKKK